MHNDIDKLCKTDETALYQNALEIISLHSYESFVLLLLKMYINVVLKKNNKVIKKRNLFNFAHIHKCFYYPHIYHLNSLYASLNSIFRLFCKKGFLIWREK